MKQFVFILLVGLFSFNSFGQDLGFSTNIKIGECYVACQQEDGSFSEREAVNCEFLKYTRDKVALKTLQIKLSNLGYDVDVNGKTDLKTIAAYKQYTKDEKKRLRKSKKKSKKKLNSKLR